MLKIELANNERPDMVNVQRDSIEQFLVYCSFELQVPTLRIQIVTSEYYQIIISEHVHDFVYRVMAYINGTKTEWS